LENSLGIMNEERLVFVFIFISKYLKHTPWLPEECVCVCMNSECKVSVIDDCDSRTQGLDFLSSRNKMAAMTKKELHIFLCMSFKQLLLAMTRANCARNLHLGWLSPA
jgi:hypothetical protein